MSEEFAALAAKVSEIDRKVDRIDAKLDTIVNGRVDTAVQIERLKTQMKFLVGGMGLVLLGGGGVGALLQLF